jgi:hypothetical protein
VEAHLFKVDLAVWEDAGGRRVKGTGAFLKVMMRKWERRSPALWASFIIVAASVVRSKGDY